MFQSGIEIGTIWTSLRYDWSHRWHLHLNYLCRFYCATDERLSALQIQTLRLFTYFINCKNSHKIAVNKKIFIIHLLISKVYRQTCRFNFANCTIKFVCLFESSMFFIRQLIIFSTIDFFITNIWFLLTEHFATFTTCFSELKRTNKWLQRRPN